MLQRAKRLAVVRGLNRPAESWRRFRQLVSPTASSTWVQHQQKADDLLIDAVLHLLYQVIGDDHYLLL